MVNLQHVIASVVHARHGILSSLYEEPEHPLLPGFHVMGSSAVDARYFRTREPYARFESNPGAGAAFDRESCIWATIGETLERYAAQLYDPDELIYATEGELGNAVVPTSEFILFGKQQYGAPGFPHAPPDPAIARHWVKGTDISSAAHRQVLVPAVFVYLGLKAKHMQENITQTASTGLSCAQSHEQAIMGGLCEVIERDAFSAMWHLRYSPAPLHLNEATKERLQRGVRSVLEQGHVDIQLWSLTTDVGLPVVLAIATSEREGLMACGACAHSLVERAIDKGVIEALHGLAWSRLMKGRGVALPTREQIRTPTDHFSYYLNPTRRAPLEFLVKNEVPVESESLCQPGLATYPQIVERLASIGKRVVVVDVTPDDVASLGLHVLRVIVPGLNPLLFGSDLVSQDERRVNELAQHWGVVASGTPNPDPHPFP
jgi:ribosomal protein S12 methylthiotransferase accessory factor